MLVLVLVLVLVPVPVLALVAVGLALLVKTLVFGAFSIPSVSMQTTLAVGDRILVNQLVYRTREPQRATGWRAASMVG